jgi:phage terminase large subunit
LPTVTLPSNGWRPRDYQRPLWDYLEKGGTRAIQFAHRRWGKDDVALHRSAIAAHQRVGTYWHMLPEAAQARKAIWDAIDPHTGRRRIDLAFPIELRDVTRENEMFIRMKVGSTWQVVGSDNFNSLVGSPPIGLVSSEHALANPAAWAYLRPILLENGGWFLAITTPRGKNHAYSMLKAHQGEPSWYAGIQSALHTNVFTPEQLTDELHSYLSEYGDDQGQALFDQEYLCSFEAAILGAYFAGELAKMRAAGRIGSFPWVEGLPVYVGGDLGRTDTTALWFWQMVDGSPRFIDYAEHAGKDVPFFVDLLRAKPYTYAELPLWLPHDAKAETLASPRSVQRQFRDAGFRNRIVQARDVQEGIQASRATLNRCTIDEDSCADGLEALTAYQREWDADLRRFKDHPLHNWASNGADGFRYCSVAWRQDWERPDVEPLPSIPQRIDQQGARVHTFNDALTAVRRRRSH